MISASGEKIVSTQNYIASYIGAKVLENGGNAFDAAVAISGVLSVVMPHTSGLGGDAFLLAKTPEGFLAYNASGWAPKNLKVEKIDEKSPFSITVPGLVDLWDFLQSYTSKDYEELLSPAIKLAINGFNVGRSLHNAIKVSSGNSEWNKIFGNKKFSDKVKNLELGKILKQVSKEPRVFYEKIAEDLVKDLNNEGSPLVYEDFYDFHGEKVNPLKTTYKDFNLYELPPNTQGITTLELLKMIEISKINKLAYNDIKRINEHVNMSILAYEDRDKYVADPRFYNIPGFILDEKYLTERVKNIGKSFNVNDGDTTFFVVGDGENHIGFIQSLFHPFGSGIVSHGIVFSNRGYGFSSGVNKPEGRKRPLHTLSILYAEKDKEELIIGCAGGDLRPQIHSEVFEYYADYGMEIDESVDAPRFMYLGNKTIAEKRLEVPLTQVGYYSTQVGVVHALKRKNNSYIAVADPRSEGVALPVQ
ncbi:gamma-glutamyltransferase family protein [Acidianus brierleyi]|uniref:gamma-glutamyltransferase family protein n=1 Tax=Acidianus brierleyi TaxID=41673 RepID=UPI00144300B9|nr:gamma-glutamyltransferase family protein [Acidianus brierleyi]AWR94265.2 gamma-glutamyltransferase family protein [Acidianus brierleyi]